MVEQKLERDPDYQAEFERALQVIAQHQDFILTTHLNPDGDGLGCESALLLALTRMGKRVSVVNAHPVPAVYHYLPGQDQFKAESQHTPRHHEVAIVLECPTEDRTGGVLHLPGDAAHVINIDHHAFNSRYGTINLIDPTAAAAGEQVWDLLCGLDCTRDQRMAIGIYTAIATDTGHFKYSAVTPRTHLIIAELLQLGVQAGYMNEQLYEQMPAQALALLARALCGVQYNARRNLGWFSVTRQMLAETGAQENQTENFVNYVRGVAGVEVAIFFTELAHGRVKVSLRSRGAVDVSAVAHELGGGGHRAAAGVTLSGSLNEVQARVLAPLEKRVAVKE